MVIGTDNHHRVTLAAPCDGLLRQQNGVVDLRLLQLDAHVQAGQKLLVGIGDFRAQRYLTAGGIHRQVGEQQAAGEWVGASILQHDGNAGSTLARWLVLPIGQPSPELERFGRRLGEVHIHRINLLNHRKLRRIPLSDQRALCDQRAPNATRDRRGDRGIAQIDVGRLHVGLAHRDIRFGLFLRCHGVRVGLLADHAGLEQRLVALGQCRRLRQIGLSPRLPRFCADGGRRVRRGINGEQQLSRLHVTAFAKQALLQNTGNSRPDLGHARSLQTARQLGHQADRALRHSHDTNLSRWRRRATRSSRGIATFATASQRQ